MSTTGQTSGDSSLDFHLFLKLLAAVSLAGSAVCGLRGPRLWPAVAFCPFLLSCEDLSQPLPVPWAAPEHPLEDTPPGFLSGIAELALLSLALGGYDFSSTVTLWKHVKDRRGYGLLQPVHPFFKHMTLSSQKKMPISTPCCRKPAPRAAGCTWVHPPCWPKCPPDGKNSEVGA